MNKSFDEQIEEITNILGKYKELVKKPKFKSYSEEEMYNLLLFGASIKLDESITLGGEIRCIGDKIEMSPRLMLSLIKSKGHTITKDEKSNKEICILHGKRGDNGNPWTESFSMEKVKNILPLTTDLRWKTHTEEMLFCIALSMLASFLFPDVIGKAYVDGEFELKKLYDTEKEFSLWTPDEIEYLEYVREMYKKKPLNYDINQLFKALEE